MVKKLVMAVAGAGKTYTICNSFGKNERVAIITYTNENVSNIIKELQKRPDLDMRYLEVTTFDSFVYRNIIKPYETLIGECFTINGFRSKGLTFDAPPKPLLDDNKTYNKKYIKKYKFRHYYCGDYLYFDRMYDLVSDLLNYFHIDLVSHFSYYFNYLFNHLYIDEFQDFMNLKYDLLIRIVKNINNITLVGDYYQHSAYNDEQGRPYYKGKLSISYEEFFKNHNKLLTIDNDSLVESRRCSPNVCDFVSKYFKIHYECSPKNVSQGKVIIIRDLESASNIIKDDDVIKLLYKDSGSYKIKAINWSLSKGSTYNSTCVVLTKGINANSFFYEQNIQQKTFNRLYIAFTRSRGDVYVVGWELFSTITKNSQLISKLK